MCRSTELEGILRLAVKTETILTEGAEMKTWIFLLVGVLLFPFLASAEVRVSIWGGERIESNEDVVVFENESASSVKVKIPFDQEYHITLNNTDSSRRALVHIKINGREATGDVLILRKGESVQLERFVDNGDFKRGPKFKFVDKDEQQRIGRAESASDGLIAVTVQYEKDQGPLVAYGQQYLASGASGAITYEWMGTTSSTVPTKNISAGTVSTSQLITDQSTSAPAIWEPGTTVEG